ncbi:MAG: hypothetical protein K8R92_00575 [Planctomycetes bacterium]|nr:hypothetical protein [Planctomycetota bacterium]
MRIPCCIAAIALSAAVISCGSDVPQPKLPAPFPAKSAQVSGAADAHAGGTATTSVADALTSSATSNPERIELPSLTLPKPAAWTFTKPTMAFRTLQYSVPGEAGGAELIVSVFKSGDGGSVDANIDRWRNQFLGSAGTPAEPARSQRSIAGAAVTRVDLKGAWKGMGMSEARPGSAQLAAAIELPKETIYIRLVGPESAVEGARQNFEAMIDGLKPR